MYLHNDYMDTRNRLYKRAGFFRGLTALPNVWNFGKGLVNAARGAITKKVPALAGVEKPTVLSHIGSSLKQVPEALLSSLPGLLFTYGVLVPRITGEDKFREKMNKQIRSAKFGLAGAATGGLLTSMTSNINPFIGSALGAGLGYVGSNLYNKEEE